MTNEELIELAIKASENAYTPFSKFKVGAVLLSKSGKVYSGCNIENSSYSPTNCAERTAFFKAISEGEKEFSKIAIVGGANGKFTEDCFPCGVCRQVMKEFCENDFKIIVGKQDLIYQEYTLDELLPHGFKL